MKLLDKKSVNTLKQKERKAEIDEGITLAKDIETLRALRLEEEKNLIDYRNRAIGEIQSEVNTLLSTKEALEGECKSLQTTRTLLLEPLDIEWAELDKAKQQIIQDKHQVYLAGEQLKIEERKDKETKKSILLSITKARKIEKDANKLFGEAITFKENAENEYEMAKSEHDIQTKEYGVRLDEIELLKQTYQNGINVNKMEEDKLKEWEDEIIIREQDLARRSKVLEIAQGVQNGNNNSSTNKSGQQ